MFALFECSGDFGEAARLLSDHGYGDKGTLIPPDDSDVDLSGILGSAEVTEIVRETNVDPGYIINAGAK